MSKTTPAETTDVNAEKTNHLKGIALLLLMWHHLFGVAYIRGWLAVIPGIQPVEFIFGAAGKICISIFLFCSGCGLYRSYINNEKPKKFYIFQRLVKVLIPYWIIMLIAVIYLMFAGKFDPRYVFPNLFALIHSNDMMYVSFSWFIKLYLLLILLLPLVRLIERKWKKNALMDILIYIVLPLAVALVFARYQDESRFVDVPSFLVSTALFALSWFPQFAIGFLFAKYGSYRYVRKAADKMPAFLTITLSITVIAVMMFLKYLTGLYFKNTIIFLDSMDDVLYGPVIICGFLLIIDNLKYKSKYVIPYLGRNSIFYWLLSGMFFLNTVELLPIITWPRVSLLIYLWTFLLLTPFVFCCSWLSDKLIKLICRKT